MNDAARLRGQAVEAARLGRTAEAKALHERAVAAAPADPAILNSAAFFLSKQGEVERAIALLRRAIAVDRSASEPLFNLALILTGAGRSGEARDLLVEQEAAFASIPRYWSIRAGAERALGAKRDALASYDRAARGDPANARAIHGRARMSLETGRPAAELYRELVAAQPGDAEAWLGYAQALEAEHRGGEARQLVEQMLARAPGWTAALELLAQLRWASDEQDKFADHYAAAAAKVRDPAIYASWCRTLAGVDRHAEAAAVAAAARRALGDPPAFALIEAGYRGDVGDDAAAEAIFASLAFAAPERDLHEARHRLRTGDAADAERLSAQVIATNPDHVAAWALRGIAWRLLGDARGEWLHGQPGLVASLPLDLDAGALAEALAYLDRLHDESAVPVGQSVRQGTQTRGGLFDRHEPEVRRIEQAFRRAIDDYRTGLPPVDAAHPLLRHRDDPWRIAGSWSIRLLDAGHHVHHIHPHGLISSAAWFAVPAAAADAEAKAGWLELGRPPADLRLDLPALATLEPRVGTCTLFPSTLYHGTRLFPAGKRVSVAIDINRDGAS
jgi:Flp pilus assembly protein TadD